MVVEHNIETIGDAIVDNLTDTSHPRGVDDTLGIAMDSPRTGDAHRTEALLTDIVDEGLRGRRRLPRGLTTGGFEGIAQIPARIHLASEPAGVGRKSCGGHESHQQQGIDSSDHDSWQPLERPRACCSTSLDTLHGVGAYHSALSTVDNGRRTTLLAQTCGVVGVPSEGSIPQLAAVWLRY